MPESYRVTCTKQWRDNKLSTEELTLPIQALKAYLGDLTFGSYRIDANGYPEGVDYVFHQFPKRPDGGLSDAIQFLVWIEKIEEEEIEV